MAFAGPKSGNGLTVGFGTTGSYGSDSTNTNEVTSLTIDGISIGDIETSHLGTTGYRTYIPNQLKEGGTVSVDFIVDADVIPEPLSTVETITITVPITDGTNSTNGTIAFSSYINNLTINYSNDDIVSGTYTLKIADDVTFTDSSV